jgi:hypothetical protein
VFRFWIIEIGDERHDDSKLIIGRKVHTSVGIGNGSLTHQAKSETLFDANFGPRAVDFPVGKHLTTH